MTAPTVSWLPARTVTGFWESSRCRSQDCMATQPLLLTLRPNLKVSTCSTQVTPAHRLVEVDLVRRNGAPALAGCYLVEMLHAADNFSTEEHTVENAASSSH